MVGPSKASDLFCALVWKLVGEHRRARRIHLILDNYVIHWSKRTKRFLAQFGDRVVLHFLPPYCPDDNRIERVWLDLHANITPNHRCRTMEELMVQVVAFRAPTISARSSILHSSPRPVFPDRDRSFSGLNEGAA